MKKKILMAGMLGLAAISLAACAKTADTKSADVEENKVSASKEETKNELTVWCWDPNFNVYAMKEAEKAYQKDHPDFKLNVVVTPWPDIQTKVITAATSNDLSTLPDILLMQDNAYQKNVINYPDVFVDLDNSGINYDDFAKAKTAYSVIDGKHYGVPFDNGAVVATYRTDILEEAGFTVKDFENITWDEYLEKGKVVLEKTGLPLVSGISGETDLIMMMIQSAGASLFDDEGKPNFVGNETVINVMNTYKELKEAGVLLEINDWDQYVSGMNTGKVAGTINGCWILGSVQVAKDQAGKWGVTNMPKLVGVDSATNYSNNGGSSWAVTANANKELSYDFLKSTFGSNVEFYETILPQSGALATYIPAGDSDAYAVPQEFFGGQAIYKDITDFASKVPSNNTGVYYYEAREAMATAMQKVLSGEDIDAALKEAQATVEFAME